MPVLTSLLEAFRLRARVFHNAQYCGTWGVDTATPHRASFHFVARGDCTFRLRERPDEVRTLTTGDLIVLPRGTPHIVGSADCSPAQINEATSVPYAEGEVEDSVALMCGYFEFDHVGPNPVADALPDCVFLRTAQPPHQGLLAPVTAALQHESHNTSHGSAVVIDRLAEILFVHLLRVHLAAHAQVPGLAAALADPGIRRALELVHRKPDTKWSVAEMGAAAGMSRSTFADRFRRLSGMSPMEYCTQWRMQRAYRWLVDEDIPVLEAALRCGYEGESSFSRAFKRVIGVSPSAVRRNRAG
ncbi:MAG: AraC family transcriptional regulator [Deltaproteobacteria bacterium]|nr:AraC family transcriptional regulator [Deltaproteobacteria bacterium]